MKLISAIQTSLALMFFIIFLLLYIETHNTLTFIPIIISSVMTFYSIFDTIEDTIEYIIKNQLKK